MLLTEKFKRINVVKFSFGKSNSFAETFAKECGAFSMYDREYSLGIPGNLSSENQLRGVFHQIMRANGQFLFNISGVNLKKARRGFSSYEEAESNNQITEWELFTILRNRDYLKNCIFHNGKVQFKKRILWKSIM
jgi:hypothetical protein